MKISGLISGAVSLWTGSRDGLMVWEELLIMENVRLPQEEPMWIQMDSGILFRKKIMKKLTVIYAKCTKISIHCTKKQCIDINKN